MLMLDGCVLSPGMNINDKTWHITNTKQASNVEDNIKVQTITVDMINQLAKSWLESSGVRSLDGEAVFLKSVQDYRYYVQPQDILKITVWGHPELASSSGELRAAASSGSVVRYDGTIFYPHIGIVYVAGKTVEEIRKLLVLKLSSYIEKPQLDVIVSNYRSQKVYVIGSVTTPMVLPLTDVPLTVLDALNQAQGALPEADLSHVTISRNGKVHNVDVFKLLNKGYLEENRVLYSGDTVYVPNNNLNKVFVLGEVKTQTSLLIPSEGMTLAEAISGVGGFDLETSDPENVFVIRSVRAENVDVQAVDRMKLAASMQVYHLNSKSPDAILLADQFQLHSRDIIYVSTKGVARWSRMLSKLSTTINAIAVTRALTR